MIDEAYDRAYQGARPELNRSIGRLFARLSRAIRQRQSRPAGDPTCTPTPSPPSPRCR